MKLPGFLDARRQFLLYCVIGVCGVTLDFLVYAALVKWAGLHHQLGNAISYSLGTINNFFLNAAFNFRKRDRMLARFVSFYAVGLLGLAVSAMLLWLLIDRAGFDKLWSKLATLFVVVLVQYNLNRWVSFRKAETGP